MSLLRKKKPANFYPIDWANSLFGIDGDSRRINTRTTQGQAVAYATCSVLLSVIGKKSRAIKNAKVWAVDSSGEQVANQGIVDIMAKPNEHQSLLEFASMICTFYSVFGKCYIYKMMIPGYGVPALYVIPNTLIAEIPKTGLNNPFDPSGDVSYYQVTIDGQTLRLNPDEVEMVYDATHDLRDVYGSISRLESLENAINTFVSSHEAVNELVVHRGALGIISLNAGNDVSTIAQDAIPQLKKEKEDVQRELNNNYGILRRKWKYILTKFTASYTPVSSTIRDLGLSEIQKICKQDIADTFGVPSVLLDVEGTTYSNLSDAKKILYTDTIIPEANNIFETLNKIYGNDSVRVMPFFDHLEFYQAAKMSQTAGLTSLINGLTQAVQGGLISQEQAQRELQNYLT